MALGCSVVGHALAQTERVVDGLRITQVLHGLGHPWSLAFLPPAADRPPQALVMQRDAGLLLVDTPAQGLWKVRHPVATMFLAT